MEFFDVALWILYAAVTLWSIQRKQPNPRFKIRISVVLFSVALFPIAYAFVYPGAEIVGLMVVPSLIFLFLAAFALLREQEDKHRHAETLQAETIEPSPSESIAPQVANERQTHKVFFVWSATIAIFTAIYYFTLNMRCPSGQNGEPDLDPNYVPSSSGISCFWDVPLTNFFSPMLFIGASVLFIFGLLRLKANKR